MHRGWYSTTLSSYRSVSKKSDTGHPGLESRCWQGYTDHSHFTTSTSSWRSHFPHFWGPTYHIGLTWIMWDSSNLKVIWLSSIQFSSVAQSCPTLCDPMDCSTPGLLAHHQLSEFIQTHVHWVWDATQPSHLLSSPSLPAFNLSKHQCLFKWVSSSNGGQSIGVSASASVLLMNIQDWFPLGWTGWISLLSKGLSRVFSNTIAKASILWCSAFFIVQLSHPYMITGKAITLTRQTFVGKVILWFLIGCLG